MHKNRRLLASVGVAGALALIAAGCSGGAGADAPDRLQVVATTTQVADISQQVAGDAVSITPLLEPGASAHSFDPTPAALQALASADVLIMNGAGLEDWLEPVIESSGFDGEIIDASSGVELIAIDDHDHEEAHDHGAHDPHIWTDPASAISMTRTISDELAAVDADSAAEFAANAERYTAELEELRAWMQEAFDEVPADERLLITNHDTFQYLARAFGLTVVGSVLPSFDDNAEVSAAAIDRLVADIEATGAVAVFSEAQLSPAVAETIAREAGVEVYSGDEALYTDSLGAPGSPGETYIGSQIHNTELMVEAWGGEAPPAPETLR